MVVKKKEVWNGGGRWCKGYMTAVAGMDVGVFSCGVGKRVQVDLGYQCVLCVFGGGGVYLGKCFSTCVKGLVRWASSLVVGGIVVFSTADDVQF
jgi:hypothetical protein